MIEPEATSIVLLPISSCNNWTETLEAHHHVSKQGLVSDPSSLILIGAGSETETQQPP